MVQFKKSIAVKHVAPEGNMGRIAMPLQICRSHAEGKNMHLKGRLAGIESTVCDGVDLLDDRIGHGKATNREALAVHHDHPA